MQERCILLFWIFLLFFSEFSCLGHVWTEFVLKMFFTLSRPTSSSFGKRYCREEVLYFFEFFYYFFRNFLAPVEYERNSRLKFFFLPFLAYLIPFWQKIMPGRGFIIFWIFLVFFSEFSCPGRVWTEFETKLFFPRFWPISTSFGKK